jgi:cellulase
VGTLHRFKVFEDGWAPANKGSGDNDLWGVKDMNSCCGKVDVKIPSDLAPGDYLLRAEVIALHTAQSTNGAQFYMSCCMSNFSHSAPQVTNEGVPADQLTVAGTGSNSPATVKIPGAYKSSDPGIQVNIHAALAKYVVPGPAVIPGGTTKAAGSSVCAKSSKMIRGSNDVFWY